MRHPSWDIATPIAALALAAALAAGASAQSPPASGADHDDRPAPRPSIQPEAEVVLRKVSEHYGKLRHLRATITVGLEVEHTGVVVKEIEGDYALRFLRPGMVSLRAADDTGWCSVICDGERLVTYLPTTKRYVEEEAPPGLLESLEQASRIMASAGSPANGLEAFVLMALLGDDPYRSMLTATTRVSALGVETIDDRRLQHIRFQEPTGQVDFWISAEDTPWVVRVQPEVRGLADAPSPVKITLVLRLRDWSTEPLTPAEFRFVPPEGAQRAETLAEARGLQRQVEQTPLDPPG